MNVLRRASLNALNYTSSHLNTTEKITGRSMIAAMGNWKKSYHNTSTIHRSNKYHRIFKQLDSLSINSNTNKKGNFSQMNNNSNTILLPSTITTTMTTIATSMTTNNTNNHNNNKLHNSNHNNDFNLSKLASLSQRNHSSQFKRRKRQLGLCFLGAPGVGKGTYSTRIASHFDAKILSSGDLIRECAKVNEGTALGNQLVDCINRGQLVPDDIVIPMVVQYLRMLNESFILDGFPRTLNQAAKIHFDYRLHCVAYFKLPDHILIKKILGRRICTNCGSNFNVAHIEEGDIHMPSMAPQQDGICDKCGHELSMRPDDTEETIKERLRIFHAETGPIEEFYRDAGLLLEYNIKRGIDDIPDILNSLDAFVAQYDEQSESMEEVAQWEGLQSHFVNQQQQQWNAAFA